MPEIIKNHKKTSISIGTLLILIPLLAQAIMFVDVRYAHAAKMDEYQVGSESAFVQINIDILEDRLIRESEKIAPDLEKVMRLTRRIDNLENRQVVIDTKILDLMTN